MIGFIDRDSDFDFSDFLLEEKPYRKNYKNILIYEISYKTSRNTKSLLDRFTKIDGFIKAHNGFKCFALFHYGWFDKICDRNK